MVESTTPKSTSLEIMRELFTEFVDFAEVVWNNAIPGRPSLTPMQIELAHYMQYGPERKFIGAFRGVGKSYLAAAYAVFKLFHDVNEQVLVLSGSPKKATDLSGWARGLIDNPGLPMLHFLKPSKRDAVLSWDVGPSVLQQSSSFTAFSVGAGIQGQRATLVILDDCEMKNNSNTEFLRARLMLQMLDVSTMVLPDRRCEILGLGTFQTMMSVYQELITERGFDAVFVPAQVPPKTDVSDYGGNLLPSIRDRAQNSDETGLPTDTRFSAAHLAREKLALGPVQYQLEYMLSTKFGDRMAHPFPLERLIVWDEVNPHGAPKNIVPGVGNKHRIDDLNFCGLAGDAFYGPSSVDTSTMLPYSRKAMYIDPAGNSGVDEAAFAVLGAVPGKLYLLDAGGKVNGADPKVVRWLVGKAREWQVTRIVYESNMASWGALFEQAMAEEGYHCELEGVPSSINKATRIIGELEPVICGGQLVVARNVFAKEWHEGMRSSSGTRNWRERLLQYQLAMYRRTKKAGGLRVDDRVDALAIGVADLAEQYLRTNTAAAARQHEDMLYEEAHLDWAEDTFGGDRQPMRWVNV